jgi:hypothetical protein
LHIATELREGKAYLAKYAGQGWTLGEVVSPQVRACTNHPAVMTGMRTYTTAAATCLS